MQTDHKYTQNDFVIFVTSYLNWLQVLVIKITAVRLIPTDVRLIPTMIDKYDIHRTFKHLV